MPIEDSQVSVGGLVTIGLYFLFKLFNKDSSLLPDYVKTPLMVRALTTSGSGVSKIKYLTVRPEPSRRAPN